MLNMREKERDYSNHNNVSHQVSSGNHTSYHGPLAPEEGVVISKGGRNNYGEELKAQMVSIRE